ncbi:MAG: DUF432 domain-containing protein [Sulfolobales archaeon]
MDWGFVLYCSEFRELYVDGEERVDLGVVTVDLRRINSELVGVLVRYGDTELFQGTISVSSEKPVAIMPHPPSGGKYGAECLLARFYSDIYVPPGEATSVYQQVPLDIGLYHGSALITVVPVRPKYALYGPPDLGDLCRYSSSDVVQDLSPCLKTPIRIRLFNTSKAVVRVTKAVVPLRGLGLYLSPEKMPLITSARLVAHSQSYAEVTTELLPSLEVEGVSKLLVEPSVATYIMRYGL